MSGGVRRPRSRCQSSESISGSWPAAAPAAWLCPGKRAASGAYRRASAGPWDRSAERGWSWTSDGARWPGKSPETCSAPGPRSWVSSIATAAQPYTKMCSTLHMRTNVEIDDKLLSKAKKLSGLKTKREIVNEALKSFIRYQQQLGVLKLAGKFQFWDDYEHEYKRLRENPHIIED